MGTGRNTDVENEEREEMEDMETDSENEIEELEDETDDSEHRSLLDIIWDWLFSDPVEVDEDEEEITADDAEVE